MCSSYRDLSAHSGGFAGSVLPLSKCLVNQDSEADRVFPYVQLLTVFVGTPGGLAGFL